MFVNGKEIALHNGSTVPLHDVLFFVTVRFQEEARMNRMIAALVCVCAYVERVAELVTQQIQ